MPLSFPPIRPVVVDGQTRWQATCRTCGQDVCTRPQVVKAAVEECRRAHGPEKTCRLAIPPVVRCAKCGHHAASEDALEKHLEDAQHTQDPDFPHYRASVRVELAEKALAAAQLRVDEARATLTELENDDPVTCGHVSEFGVCCRRRGHLEDGVAHEYAIVEVRAGAPRCPSQQEPGHRCSLPLGHDGRHECQCHGEGKP